MAQSQHGYSINEFIERNLGRVTGMKRATAYALLEKLEQKGLVRMETVTVGNYPPRKVYSITPAGRDVFLKLLQELLVDTDQRASAVDIALMFTDWLERDRVIELLQERASRLRAQAAQLSVTPDHEHTPGVNHSLQRKITLLKAEEEWILDLIRRLQDRGLGDQPASYPSGGAQS